MFPNLEEQQRKIQEKLSAQEVEGNSGNGAILVKANAIPEIKSIMIDRSKLDINQEDELEDLLIIAINDVIINAQAVQSRISQEAISDMLPPGMGNLKDLFGGL